MGFLAESTIALYSVWHEQAHEAQHFAAWLQSRCAANRFRNVTSGARVKVPFRTLASKSVDPTLMYRNRSTNPESRVSLGICLTKFLRASCGSVAQTRSTTPCGGARFLLGVLQSPRPQASAKRAIQVTA